MQSFKQFLQEKVSYQDSYYKLALTFFLKKFGVDTNKYDVIMKERSGMNAPDGSTFFYKGKYIIFIKPNHPRADMLRLIAHESAHVGQMVKGDLEVNNDTDEVKWKGEVVDFNKISYNRRPFEVDAVIKEKKYIHEFIKLHGNKLTETTQPISPIQPWKKQENILREIIKEAKKINNHKVLFKDITHLNHTFTLVDTDSNYASLVENDLVESLSKIGMTSTPVECDSISTGIVIPKGKFKTYSLVGENHFDTKEWTGNVILSCEEYWYINTKRLLKENKSQYKKISLKDLNENSTYNDVITMLYDYISWNEWKQNN